MATVDINKISRGFNNVMDIKNSASVKSHFEHIEPHLIRFAENNPYSLNDTPQSIEELATSIDASGLMHPIVVRKENDDKYTIISGERRYKAITTHLKWRAIPCTVYEDISDTQAQIMLHDANLATREYTPQEKLNFYPQIVECVNKMIDSGEYKGAKQKAIAELLHISDRQVRKYKAIVENLTEEEINKVASGETSINAAYEQAQNSKSGTGSDSQVYDEEFCKEAWRTHLIDFVKEHYGTEKVYKYYVTSVPSTKQAVKHILRPKYGYEACNKETYSCTLRTPSITLEAHGLWLKSLPDGVPHTMVFSYSEVDEIIRELIKERQLISYTDAQKVLNDELKLLKRRGELSAYQSR